MRDSLECCECTGCGGEVPVVDAVWLPEPRRLGERNDAQPYCSNECYMTHKAAEAAKEAT